MLSMFHSLGGAADADDGDVGKCAEVGPALGGTAQGVGREGRPPGADLRGGDPAGRDLARQRVLEIGCGTGVFLRLVADRGGVPFGLDASAALLEIARERVPEADLRAGEMEQLPYEDDTFDLVTGFNAFFFAADLVGALREAGRVARPDAPVVIQVWGPPERCDLERMKQVARRYAPPPPPGAPPPPRLWQPGVLEALATEAGLTPDCAFDFPVRVRVPRQGDARPPTDRSHGPGAARRPGARARPAPGDRRRARPLLHARRQLSPDQPVPLPRRESLIVAPRGSVRA